MVAKKVSDEEMARIAKEENLEVLQPEKNTKPRVYYKNLYRYNKCFIGGSVATKKDGVEDCIIDANVKLTKNSEIISEITTDIFGDFKFDKLDENSGSYTIEVAADGYKPKSVNVDLRDSITLEDIYL